jgi:RNA polymerase sigma-70 factor (ECF subfamily)
LQDDEIRKIYEEYYNEVYSFLLFFTRDRNNVEDMTQEVFVRVYRLFSSSERPSNFKAWILTIAKNIAIDHYRKHRFYSLLPDVFFKKLSTKSGMPESVFETKEEWLFLEKAIQRLNHQHRLIILLRAIKEFSIKETAEILQCSESKVKTDYHRALKKLGKHFIAYGNGGQVSEWAKREGIEVSQ